jgi:hypothetical protein
MTERTALERLQGRLGVELYTDRGRLKADDLLIRERVSQALGEVKTHVRSLMERWRERIPLPTREQPFPPAELTAPVKAAESLLHEIESTATVVLGLPVLNVDKVWAKARSAGLDELLQFDWTLVSESETLAEEVRTVTSLDRLDRASVEARLGTLDGVVRERTHYIQIMG